MVGKGNTQIGPRVSVDMPFPIVVAAVSGVRKRPAVTSDIRKPAASTARVSSFRALCSTSLSKSAPFSRLSPAQVGYFAKS